MDIHKKELYLVGKENLEDLLIIDQKRFKLFGSW